MKTFGQLFKTYRLRAEFASLSEFADAFAQKGFFYEQSIFSHWQNGNRIPSNRKVVINLIEVFIESGAIKTYEQANEILESAGHGYLTNTELQNLISIYSPVFSKYS